MSSPIMKMNQTCVSLYGDGRNSQLSCTMPSALQGNLLSKAVGASVMYLNNTNIPVFVPELATSATTSYSAGATISHLLGTGGGVNALDYFIVLRRNDNGTASACIVNWTPVNDNALTPPGNTPDENSVFTTPYYHCFNFGDFLDMVRHAILLAMLDQLGAANAPMFIFDAESQTFNVSIPGIYVQYTLEFSEKLVQLFPFQVTKTAYNSYAIPWSSFKVQIDGTSYYNATCALYDTIFPFDLILINTDLPIEPVEFISNAAQQYPIPKPAMFMFRKITPGLSIYNAFIATNEYMFDKVHSFTQAKPKDGNKMSSTVILRTRKNQNYFAWTLNVGSKLELVLNTYSTI